MEPAIRRLQLSATAILHRLHQGMGRIAYVILEIGIFVEIIVAGCVRREIADIPVDQG